MFDFMFKFFVLMVGNLTLLICAFLSMESIVESLKVMKKTTKERAGGLRLIAYCMHALAIVVVTISAIYAVQSNLGATIELLMRMLLGNLIYAGAVNFGSVYLLRENYDKAHHYGVTSGVSDSPDYNALVENTNNCNALWLLIFILWCIGRGYN